jgi:membrane protein required for colicin V production
MVVDIIFILILAWAAYRGYSKGLFVQIATFAALFLGIFGAIKLSGFTTGILIQKFELSGEYLRIISFAVTFIAIVILVHFIARLLEKLAEAVALGMINRLLGVLFSMIKYAFIISIFLVVLNTIHNYKPYLPVQLLSKSKLYKPLSNLAPAIFPYLRFGVPKEKIEDFQETIQV